MSNKQKKPFSIKTLRAFLKKNREFQIIQQALDMLQYDCYLLSYECNNIDTRFIAGKIYHNRHEQANLGGLMVQCLLKQKAAISYLKQYKNEIFLLFHIAEKYKTDEEIKVEINLCIDDAIKKAKAEAEEAFDLLCTNVGLKMEGGQNDAL